MPMGKCPGGGQHVVALCLYFKPLVQIAEEGLIDTALPLSDFQHGSGVVQTVDPIKTLRSHTVGEQASSAPHI